MIDASTIMDRIAASTQRDVAIAALVRRGGEAEVSEFTAALAMFDQARGRDDGVARSLHEAARHRIAAVTPRLVELAETIREVAATATETDVRDAALARLEELREVLELTSQAQMVAVL